MTTLQDKIKGCFLGKNIGGTLGMYNEGLEGYSELTYYEPVPTEPLPNDDLDLQVIWLQCIKKAGLALDNKQLGKAWLDHIDIHFDEYGIAVWNLKRGIEPPLSGLHNNFFTNGMGAAIRSEIWACLFPGKPLTAAYYAYQDASVDHWGDGVWGEMYLAAVQSHLFESDNFRKSLEFGLGLLPEQSELKQALVDIMQRYDTGESYLELRDHIKEVWGSHNFTDCIMNISFIVLGLLFGEGDYDKTLLYAVNCGQDADCTGATTGGFLGILLGAEAIPAKWTRPIGDKIVIGDYNGVTAPENLDAMVADICDLHERFNGQVLKEWSVPFELPENVDFSDQIHWTVNGKKTIFRGIKLDAATYGQLATKTGAELETRVRFSDSQDVQLMVCSRALFKVEVDGRYLGGKGDLMRPIPAFHRIRGGRGFCLNVENDRVYHIKISVKPTIPMEDVYVSFGDMANRHLSVVYEEME